MKQLKPGQLCTIKGHVYRCKKNTNPYCLPCAECEEANCNECILEENDSHWFYSARICDKFFGPQNYPVLVK